MHNVIDLRPSVAATITTEYASRADLVKWLTIACVDLAQEAAFQRNARHHDLEENYRVEAQRAARLAQLLDGRRTA